MVTRTPDTLEPLLVPTLRLLIALPLVVLLVPLLLDTLAPSITRGMLPPAGAAGIPFLIAEMITLLLLAVPGLPARLGRWFLPITLFFCTLGPVGTMVAHITQFPANAELGIALPLPVFGFQGIWPLTFFLTIPLIVIAWQYTLRWVVAFTVCLGIIDGVLAAYLVVTGHRDAAWSMLQLALGRTGVFLATGYLVSQLVESQRRQRAALAAANTQLVQYALTQEQLAASRERNRLARDLHDTLAHYLSGLVLELEGARLLWDADSAEARKTLDTAIGTARSGMAETRRALQALRASPLIDLGLIGAMRELAAGMAVRNQWRLRLELPRTPMILLPPEDEVVYRIAQEALTNVERHAAAAAVTLAVQMDGELLRLRVEDDGCGFDPERVAAGERLGILGMQERSQLAGGNLAIRSAAGGGTAVLFTLVVKQSAPPEAPELVLPVTADIGAGIRETCP